MNVIHSSDHHAHLSCIEMLWYLGKKCMIVGTVESNRIMNRSRFLGWFMTLVKLHKNLPTVDFGLRSTAALCVALPLSKNISKVISPSMSTESWVRSTLEKHMLLIFPYNTRVKCKSHREF